MLTLAPFLALLAIGCEDVLAPMEVSEDTPGVQEENPQDVNQPVGESADGIVNESNQTSDSYPEINRSTDGPPTEQTQVLFGDTHVHSRYSLDAFVMMAIEGDILEGRDVAEACDFADLCADLDFFVSSEHAEFITEDIWGLIKDEVRDCNTRAETLAGREDFMAFAGWEWTQTGSLNGVPLGTQETTAWGHKVIFFLSDQDDQLPERTISALQTNMLDELLFEDTVLEGFDGSWLTLALEQDLPEAVEPFDEYMSLFSMDTCTDTLTTDCFEYASTPGELFTRLDEMGYPTIVGAHGTVWGFGGWADWQEQITPDDHWPEFQVFFEIYSKHGSSEVYRQWAPEREWRDIFTDETCVDTGDDDLCEELCVEPPPGQNYLPCCWRRVELTYEHEVCRRPNSARCQAAILDARMSGADFEAEDDDDWLACGECIDCFQPASDYVPVGSIQNGLAINGGTYETPFYQDVGFIASTDSHFAAPGSVTEIKEFAEMVHTASLEEVFASLGGEAGPPTEQAVNMLYAGGLAAIHLPSDEDPTREALFEAVQRQEVYATSGPRMLLWFNLTNPDEELPMGSIVQAFDEEPEFRVHAVGAYQDTMDCDRRRYEFPMSGGDYEAFVENVCRGVCYSPDRNAPRLNIERIEVVRIQRQTSASDETDVASLIQDPWLTLPCEGDMEGDGEANCYATFTDPEYETSGRDAVYYVRAIQETTLAVNGQPLGCISENSTGCTETITCDLDDPEDECLSETNERAWSSPIYLYQGRE